MRQRFLEQYTFENSLNIGLVVVDVKIAKNKPRIIRINQKAKDVLLKSG
jgi:hypothetical protein